MTDPSRRTATVTAAAGLVVLVALAWWLVPWDPVPGGPLEPVAPSRVFSPAQVERAESYSSWARLYGWASLALSLAVACWFGFSRRGRRLAERLRGPWWLQVLQAVVVLGLVGRLATLPLAVAARDHARDFGLSHQSWLGFARDVAVGELVSVLLTTLALLVVLACARRWPRAWPAVAAALVATLVVVGSFVYPVVVEPLFNSFTPLPDGQLRTRILQLAEEEGVPVDDVLVSDASRRTTTLNAYVSGFGSTRRVVVYDTLVDALPEDQALSVVAHELAHARHHDVVVGTALGAAGAVTGVGALALLLGVLRRRGWPAMGQPAVVPVVLALVAVAGLVSSPVQSGISRQVEMRADVDALRTTERPAAFVQMQRRLALRSLADPTPVGWAHWWWGTHPTTLTRIALAARVAAEPPG